MFRLLSAQCQPSRISVWGFKSFSINSGGEKKALVPSLSQSLLLVRKSKWTCGFDSSVFPSHSVFCTWTTEHTAWTRRLHVLLMVSNSFPVFMLITYRGRGRNSGGKTSDPFFLHSSTVPKWVFHQQQLFLHVLRTLPSWTRDGWLHGCWRAPQKASVFSCWVLNKVRAFRDFDSINSQQLFSLLSFLQD